MLLKNQWPESFPAKDPGTGHHRHSAPGVKNHHVNRVILWLVSERLVQGRLFYVEWCFTSESYSEITSISWKLVETPHWTSANSKFRHRICLSNTNMLLQKSNVWTIYWSAFNRKGSLDRGDATFWRVQIRQVVQCLICSCSCNLIKKIRIYIYVYNSTESLSNMP